LEIVNIHDEASGTSEMAMKLALRRTLAQWMLEYMQMHIERSE
jgi:hypothetical protein